MYCWNLFQRCNWSQRFDSQGYLRREGVSRDEDRDRARCSVGFAFEGRLGPKGFSGPASPWGRPRIGHNRSMRHNPAHAVTDPNVVRDLVRENPWATIVSSNEGELVASHYPVLLDEDAAGLELLTHIGRPDDESHGFGEREGMVIVQGRHGYVSPSWYGPDATRAPTWNFSVA